MFTKGASCMYYCTVVRLFTVQISQKEEFLAAFARLIAFNDANITRGVPREESEPAYPGYLIPDRG